jgi:hypothetical protein
MPGYAIESNLLFSFSNLSPYHFLDSPVEKTLLRKMKWNDLFDYQDFYVKILGGGRQKWRQLKYQVIQQPLRQEKKWIR